MITAFDESAREERMYAQARLNAQNINFIEDKYEEEPQVINCNFEIIYGKRRVGPHKPEKLIIENKHKYLFNKLHGKLLH